MATLAVGPDDILRLSQLAREFHAQEAVAVPEDEPEGLGDEWLDDAFEDHHEDAFLGEFRAIILDLEPDQQMQVVALLWLGRGDYEPEEWELAVEDAVDAWTPRTADYLIAHPMLSDHLEEGLRMLGYDVE